jgi:ABC-2 type transport system ATP-binding protein
VGEALRALRRQAARHDSTGAGDSVITLRGLTKRYGDVLAVDDLTVDVAPGRVTGFLGPNGAGKSTTMRMLLGLDRPTTGTALVDGREVRTLTEPLRCVGALLDAGAVHPGRTGRDHLRVAARSNGVPLRRVDEVLGLVGLESAAGRRVGGWSLGMRQRLGIATALLGDPPVLLFDEPVNGLDLDGVRWVRGLVRDLADEGRTVLVSSHLMSEMEQTADQLVVLGRGRLLADASIEQVLRGEGGQQVRVRTPSTDVLTAALSAAGLVVRALEDRELLVEGAGVERVGDLAHEHGVVVHGLVDVRGSLEQAYLALTGTSVEHVGRQLAAEVAA